MKHVEQWVANRKGLKLPIILDDAETENKNLEELNNTNSTINYEEGLDGIIDLTKTIDDEPVSPLGLLANKLDAFCNNEFCDRLKDKTSCVSKIDVEEQGNCATSWIFASKYHLETAICMKGHDNFNTSALYVANCSKKDPKDKCLSGSNPLEFLDILQANNYLPTESNYPYNYKHVGDSCPETNQTWVNLFDKLKLENSNDGNNSIIKGYTSYESKDYKSNMNEFVGIIKNKIKKLGSVIAYAKFNDFMGYDFNGNKVHKLCGSGTPDMIVNIIGYGKYINENNEVKSYWIVRNSWGKHWADEGNFKVDIETPENCEHNFIHTALVFDFDLPPAQKNNNDASIYNYYLKNSPNFYKNLYYNHVSKTNAETAIFGQDETVQLSNAAGGGSNQVATTINTVTSQLASGATTQINQPSTTTQGQAPQSQTCPSSAVTPSQTPSGSSSGSGPTPSGGNNTSHQNNPGQSGASVQPNPSTTVETPENGGGSTERQTNSTQNTEIFHVLKVIRKKKVQTSLIKYNTYDEVEEHSCSRAMSTDSSKKEKCVTFCSNNWDSCSFNLYPGYCLNKLKGDNECNFCAV